MKRNIFLTLTGLETITVGILLLVQRNILLDDHNDKVMHFVHQMGNSEWAALLIAVGAAALVIGLLNINKYFTQTAMLIILGGLWLAYAFSFTFSDFHFGNPLHLGDLLAWFVFLQITFEAYFGEAR